MVVGESYRLSHAIKARTYSMEIMHFNSPQERMAYVKGQFEEIIPIEAEIKPIVAEEKPKKAKKTAKKAKKED